MADARSTSGVRVGIGVWVVDNEGTFTPYAPAIETIAMHRLTVSVGVVLIVMGLILLSIANGSPTHAVAAALGLAGLSAGTTALVSFWGDKHFETNMTSTWKFVGEALAFGMVMVVLIGLGTIPTEDQSGGLHDVAVEYALGVFLAAFVCRLFLVMLKQRQSRKANAPIK